MNENIEKTTSQPISQEELRRRVSLAKKLGVEAGKILLQFASTGVKEEQKGTVDFVTDADHAAESFLVKAISEDFPDDALIAEEGGGSLSPSGFGWVIDPLDGTTNFMHGVPHYAVSVGIAYGGVPVGGVIVDPNRNEIFSSIQGQGAFLNEKRISVSTRMTLERSVLATGFPYDRRAQADELLSRLKRALLTVQGIRRAGAAALDLCWVACGRYDGFFEQNLNPWDTCAGVSLVWESGGVVTGYSAKKYGFESPSLVASNPNIHAEILREIIGEA